MLDGIFYTEVLKTPRYTLAWHNRAVDAYSNLASQLNIPSGEVFSTLEEITGFFTEHRRKTTMYLTPFSTPAKLSDVLQLQGFALAYQEAWMYYRSLCVSPRLPPRVTVDTVTDQETMRFFVEVFNGAYSGLDPREPYGQAPPEWGETLYSSFNLQMTGRRVEYYMLREDGIPAAVLLTSEIEEYAGIYSVGTVPEMRGKGYGSLITLYALAELQRRGAKVVFLQTEKDSYNQEFYQKLGFLTEWTAEAWTRG